ncbi:MAG: hypothetical protein ACOCRO_07520 [Halanaerobiales bacterium]
MLNLLIIFIFIILGTRGLLDSYWSGKGGMAMGACIGISLCISMMIIAPIILPIEYEMIEQQQLFPLDGTNRIENKEFIKKYFSVGKTQYCYVADTKEGRGLRSVPTGNVAFYYDNNNPRIEKYKKVFQNKLLNKLFYIPFNKQYRIYVP